MTKNLRHRRVKPDATPLMHNSDQTPLETSDMLGYATGQGVAKEIHQRGLLKHVGKPDIPEPPKGVIPTAWKRGWKRGYDHVCMAKLGQWKSR